MYTCVIEYFDLVQFLAKHPTSLCVCVCVCVCVRMFLFLSLMMLLYFICFPDLSFAGGRQRSVSGCCV